MIRAGAVRHAVRTFGQLRPTGHESDRDLHLALNVGLPLADPTGGFYFVFVAGVPIFRKYDARGHAPLRTAHRGARSGRLPADDADPVADTRTEDGDVLPLVPPAVATAGVDFRGTCGSR